MGLDGVRVAWCLAASHHNLGRVLAHMERLISAGARVVPIVSLALQTVATRFGTPEDWLRRLEEVTGGKPLTTFPEVEPLGPGCLVDVVVMCPCTGNSLAKLANAINDSPTLFAAKAHLRNGGPVVLAVSTNDALGMNARNLGTLLNSKNVYFVPFGQDNPKEKPNSLDAHLDLLPETITAALEGRQLQPVLIERWRYQETLTTEDPKPARPASRRSRA